MPTIRFFTIAILFAWVFQFPAHSQQRTAIRGEVELGSVLSSTSTTPFWLRTNQYGIVPTQAPAGIFQAAIWKSYRQPDSVNHRNFDWGFKLNPVLTYDRYNKVKFLWPEGHVKVRYKAIELYIGRRREVTGLGDTTLSSGFYAVSGNALPIPKLQISTVGYAPIHFTHDFLAINAGFAHGWFNVPYIQDIRLHQKHLYLRFGKPASNVKIYAGLNHQVQWAGHADYLKSRPDIADNGYFPSDWRFYKYVVLSYTPSNWNTIAGYTSFDSYRVGNSVGSIDFGAEFMYRGKKFLAYYQHAYEDVSGILFQNVPDGLWGISCTMQPKKTASFQLTRLLLEFLTTKDQSGNTFYIPGSTYQGVDNYYNHGQYAEGWSYFDHTLGTPFIAPWLNLDLPFNSNGQYFPNNRVNMWHVGLQGAYKKATFTLRTSYSQNFGTYNFPFPYSLGQFSGLLSAHIPVSQRHKMAITTKIAVDNGSLYKNAVGGYIGLKKSW